ncbi:hypothetical protein BD309DRAFT_60005 [Dichomitus squalens]|uniref:SET domain-containing protein n=1 Tax=Dichomitus squalens TaxID=114155 RepID=A0A4Q9N4P7_9APHY|nr:hypothetical protein BD311DRAFT_745347 [Dichomitus squalens]TBU44137.1 hypothetical protein BD309DRAFT_60005 [Dichomitus squalens]TBU64782.1 hypothetical protein BD310DRAFT_285944 [Dichomitus squalens]
MPPKPHSNSKRPPRWPDHLQYLSEPRYHSSVPSAVRAIICPHSAGHAQPPVHAHKPPVAIQFISDPSHPAHGQFGLFATKKMPPRTLILDYIGEVHCDDRPDSDYDLSLFRTGTPDHVSVGVDAQHAGNEARFINDYRGVKAKPNALFQERRTEGGELRMSVWSGSEAIKKGDELLVSYGKSWWRARHVEDHGLDGRHVQEHSK